MRSAVERRGFCRETFFSLVGAANASKTAKTTIEAIKKVITSADEYALLFCFLFMGDAYPEISRRSLETSSK